MEPEKYRWASNYEMCAAGAKTVRAGKAGAIRFELFNRAEVEEVRSTMAEHFPDVPYQCTWVRLGAAPKETL